MDRIEAMTTLLAVVEAGSLSAASRRLRVPLTTVSRRISELEAHLKTQLLNRTSRRVTLTDAAETYIQACRRILDEVDEAERVVSGEYRAPQGRTHRHRVDGARPRSRGAGRGGVPESLSGNPAAASAQRPHRQPAGGACRSRNPHRRPARQRHRRAPDRIDPTGRLRKPGISRRAEAARKRRRISRRMIASPSPVSCVPSRGTFTSTAQSLRSRSVRGCRSMPRKPSSRPRSRGPGSSGCFRITSPQPSRTAGYRFCCKTFEPPPLPVNLVYLGGGLLPLKVRAFLDFAAPRLKAETRGRSRLNTLRRASHQWRFAEQAVPTLLENAV